MPERFIMRFVIWTLFPWLGGLVSMVLHAQERPTGNEPHSTHLRTASQVVPTYAVVRYEVADSGVLNQETIDQITREGVGPAVHLPEIRRALQRLQQAYRSRGLKTARLFMPRQALDDGTIRVQLIQDTASPLTPSSVTHPSTTNSLSFDLRHFEVRGNTVFSAEELDEILGPAANPASSPTRLAESLRKLQAAYHQRGYRDASVTTPEQILTDGTVVVVIHEGSLKLSPAPSPLETPPADQFAVTTNPPPPEPSFEVRGYDVAGNTLLPQETVESILGVAVGPDVRFAEIQKALGELQLAYRERGYATVAVGLPEQQLTDGIIKVQVTEGVLSEIRVTGNRYFSSNNIVRALPSLRTNTLPNSRVFQRELDLANQNRDRQIYPTIGPGPDPGTSLLTLRVKDRLPLHGRLELNNHGTPGTPEWRINSSVQYNNLWQREHEAGLSYGFTPEEFKSDDLVSDYFFNRPLVSYYGAYYRMPFPGGESLAEQLQRGGNFGYDEATRQFRLPPAGGRPDLTFFASGSSADTGVQYGPATIVSQTPLLTIVSQDTGQNLSINEAYGSRFNLPIALNDTRRLTLSAGLDWKRYFLESYNTNNFIITTVVTNAQGSQTIESRVSSPQPVRRNEVGYLPLAVSVDLSQTDRRGVWSANLGLSYNFIGGDTNFSSLAYSRDARQNFGKAALAVMREQKIFNDWSLLFRANGQITTGPVISNEQFALGGMNSVRGYFEGDEYGDAGWFGSVELRTPFIMSRVPTWTDFAPVWLRGSVFFDCGQRFLLDSDFPGARDRFLAGAGLGISANINNHLDMRIILAWPMTDSANTRANDPRAGFSLGGQF